MSFKVKFLVSQRDKQSTPILYNCLDIRLLFAGLSDTNKQTTRNNEFVVEAMMSTGSFNIWKWRLFKPKFIKNALLMLPLLYCDIEVYMEVRF